MKKRLVIYQPSLFRIQSIQDYLLKISRNTNGKIPQNNYIVNLPIYVVLIVCSASFNQTLKIHLYLQTTLLYLWYQAT